MARTLAGQTKDTRRNWLLNGNHAISQRGNSATLTPFTSIANGVYMTDRFVYTKTSASVHNASQDTDVPTLAQANYLFQNSLRLNLTTPDNSIAAGDYTIISQRIEGYNWANIAQKAFSLSFWVKATTAGTYCVAFVNSAGDRSYVAEYTINASATWEYKTISIAASPSAGTWNYSSGTGVQVVWTLAGGTTFQTTAGAWQTGNFIATSNQVNGVATGATDFRITGCMLNEGPIAAPFRLYTDSIADELQACQRYYEKSYSQGVFAGDNGASFAGAINFGAGTSTHRDSWVTFSVRKRTIPNVIFYAPATGAAGNGSNRSAANANVAIGIGEIGETRTYSSFSATAGSHYGYHYIADAEL